MLSELSIRNLGLIGSASIEFAPGLSVISGETGAGKSMLLSAIHLLTGGRANASAVGKLSGQLSVDSSWELDAEELSPRLKESLEELGAELEDDVLHLSRTVKSDGKSRAVLGGRPTTAKALGSVSSELLSIHGQADQLKLRDGAEQLRILDSYGLSDSAGIAALSSYRTAYGSWKRAAQTLKDVQANAALKRREIAGLKSFIEDYEAIDPQPNELGELEAVVSRLKNHEKIKERLLAAQGSLDGEDYSPLSLIERGTEELRRLKSLDPRLGELHDLAEDVCAKLEELTSALALEVDRSDDEALEELAEAQGRILEIQGLIKRSGVDSLDALEDEVIGARKALESLSVYDRPVSELEVELETARTELMGSGERLRELRVVAGEKLTELVSDELAGLAMGSMVFTVAFTAAEPSAAGIDEIAFTILQRGQDPQPMAKAASGGELSRLMLALELSVAKDHSSKTYIFDEVDAGIGGATALEVGKRLAKLAQSHQVIVVSHLAQVAAYADVNLKVSKHDDGKIVSTTVERIAEGDRAREIARMLSGVESSESAQDHARELLKSAEVHRRK